MTQEATIPPPPWRKQRKSASTKPQLSAEAIVEAALRVLDSEGLAAVSMRRIADELNTGPASLYVYFSNKEDLLDQVYERVVGEIELPEPDPARWREQLRDLCTAMYRVLSRHNDIALVAMANLPTGPNAMRIGEMMMSLLIGAGIPAQQTAWAIDRISLYVVADAYEGSLYGLRRKRSGLDEESFIREYFGQMRSYYESLPPTVFPVMSRHLDEMFSGDGDVRFLFGLDLMIDGLAKTIDPM